MFVGKMFLTVCGMDNCAVRIYCISSLVTFIRYTFLVPDWTPFSLQNCLNSSWHRFNKVLETFLRDFGPYWHDSITQWLQICRLHIHDVNLLFHHIPKVLYWIEIWWLWRLLVFEILRPAIYQVPITYLSLHWAVYLHKPIYISAGQGCSLLLNMQNVHSLYYLLLHLFASLCTHTVFWCS